MEQSEQKPASVAGWVKSALWLLLAVACFNAAYASIKYPLAGLLIFGYAVALVQLTDQPSVRRAFYFGLAAGFFCGAPQLYFFWNIFGPAAIVLWLVLAFWIGLFAALVCAAARRWGRSKAAWLIPILWTGIEYFRSELYYLKFSWLNAGYAFSGFHPAWAMSYGMYGLGFLVFAVAALPFLQWPLQRMTAEWLIIVLIGLLGLAGFVLPVLKAARHKVPKPPLSIVGIQMEFPPANILPRALDLALAKHTNADIFVLSEYTLDGPPTAALKNWCREHARFLVVGGKEPAGNGNFYNTAFVVGTNGEVVFQQAKCVPIQFFQDGLPAPGQKVWDSPWGKIGLCICYDLSYTRVTDELVRQGAQLLIVPTMDVAEWGRHEHELHARVAPVRAAEYGVPIFRLASSGISQAVNGAGRVVAETPMPGNGDLLAAQLRLPMRGSLPLDRWLAPACTGLTGIVMALLLWRAWKDKPRK